MLFPATEALLQKMLIPYESFLSTEVFRVEGPQGKLFYVHGSLLSKRSQVLAVDVNGGMIEAKTKEIKICAIDDDIDDDTVTRFIEYAYTGDYTVPEPDVVLAPGDDEQQACNGTTKSNAPRKGSASLKSQTFEDEAEVVRSPSVTSYAADPEPELETLSDMWGAWAPKSTASMKPAKKEAANGTHNQDRWCIKSEAPEPIMMGSIVSKKSNLWKSFCQKAALMPAEQWEPRTRMNENEDFTNVMLCHVQLYIFSNRWHCEDLRDLVLQKLRLTLSRYWTSADRNTEIVALIQHTYAHTQDYGDSGIDVLRDLVTDYVVCHIETIEPDRDFRMLLTGSNEIGKDLMRKLMKRLV